MHAQLPFARSARWFPAGCLVLALAMPLLAADTQPAAPAARPADSAKAAPAAPPSRVDLNLASEADLEALPKIGPATAKRIVEYRKQVGTIKSVEELVNVQGIGPKTLELLRPHVTVGASVPAPSSAKKP
jgi:comEA protein